MWELVESAIAVGLGIIITVVVLIAVVELGGRDHYGKGWRDVASMEGGDDEGWAEDDDDDADDDDDDDAPLTRELGGP